jgi:hypothetical protein
MILKFVTIVMDCHDEPISLRQFLDEVKQIGKAFNVTEDEILIVIYERSPIEFAVSPKI